MPSAFTRQEQVQFDQMVAGFDDGLVIAKAAEVDTSLMSGEEAERSGDRFWVPQPLISASFDGFDQTSNFGDGTELSVPVSIGFHKSVPIKLTAKNLRNERFLRNKANSAKQKLASDVNLALYNTVALQGAIFVKRTVAPTGFDDVALADAAMTEIGVPTGDRFYFASPRTANAMAGNLASRQTFSGEVQDAYERARLGVDIAGFDVYKNDQSIRLTAAAATGVTVNGANQRWVPKAASTAATGEISNVDNRYSDLAVTVTGGTAKVGDAFTIAGVNSVHGITKQDTGQLQTFRIIAIKTGGGGTGTWTIAPAIISADSSPTRPETEYKNVTAAPAGGAAITFLNTAAADMNPFFKKESLLLVPGGFVVDPDDGWQVMRATTDLGVAITYARQGEINDLSVKARWDVDFGTSLLNPLMAGVEMFNQV